MDFKHALKNLESGKNINFSEACIWLGALTDDWTTVRDRGALETLIVDRVEKHIADYQDTPELRFMAPDMRDGIVDYRSVFRDRHKFMAYALMVLEHEYRDKATPEKKKNDADVRLASRMGMNPGLLRTELKEAALAGRINAPSWVDVMRDEAQVMFSTSEGTAAVERRLYSEAFDAVFYGENPKAILREFSTMAAAGHAADLAAAHEDHIGQGREHRRAPTPAA